MSNTEYLDVFLSVQAFQEEELRGKTAVIIDVLRACSSMTTALHNGAKKIIPVADMGDASKIAQTMDAHDFLLCGEKNGVKIDGYHLGNSPLEYTEEAVKDKTLIFNTTNGTKAIKKSGLANHIYLGTFLNQKALVDELRDHDDEIILICSGWHGRQSIEDTLFAGAVIHDLYNGTLPVTARDGVKMAFGLYEQHKSDIEAAIQASDHARRLQSLEVKKDIAFCCQVDTFSVLPGMKDGILTDLNGQG
ncbi:MAG: 2-phosphosulfolactate phosphatase [Bacteroidota bacterium]